jgi:hypothetical protein
MAKLVEHSLGLVERKQRRCVTYGRSKVANDTYDRCYTHTIVIALLCEVTTPSATALRLTWIRVEVQQGEV